MPSTFPTPVPLTTATLPDTDFRRDTALPFLSSLKAGSVDLILTDPPYLISRKSGFSHVVKAKNASAPVWISAIGTPRRRST